MSRTGKVTGITIFGLYRGDLGCAQSVVCSACRQTPALQVNAPPPYWRSLKLPLGEQTLTSAMTYQRKLFV
jgi:hypothetical protein